MATLATMIPAIALLAVHIHAVSAFPLARDTCEAQPGGCGQQHVLLQVHRGATARWTPPDWPSLGGGADPAGVPKEKEVGTCCLSRWRAAGTAGGNRTLACGECRQVPWLQRWCGHSRSRCERVCRAAWCPEQKEGHMPAQEQPESDAGQGLGDAEPDAAEEPAPGVEPVTPAVDVGYSVSGGGDAVVGSCCLAAQNQNDMCGTCRGGSWATPGSWCSLAASNCGECSSGRAQWCASAAESLAPALPEQPAQGQGQSQSSNQTSASSSCCFAAADEQNACATCYSDSWATAGDYCSQSEGHCLSCSPSHATWCGGGAALSGEGDPPQQIDPEAATPAPAPRAGVDDHTGPADDLQDSAPLESGQPDTSAAGRCCKASADDANSCATCYSHAWAEAGEWCAKSTANCAKCSGSWCADGDASEAAGVQTPAPQVPAQGTPASGNSPTQALTESITTPPPGVQTQPPPAPAQSTPASGNSPTESATEPVATLPSAGAPQAASPDSTWISGTFTTGYWDCCKPSCSWPGKGNVTQPAQACDASTGDRLADPSVKSVCEDGGSAASCVDNQPFTVTPRLSMGFAAAAVGGISGLHGDANCGQCYELVFEDTRHSAGNWGGSHPDLVGKGMVLQVSNIGHDVHGTHSFDIQIPGAGQGMYSSGCPKQFPGTTSGEFDCENNYGGCSAKEECSTLPAALRPGCEWRFDWYRWLVAAGQTNNPYVKFRRVRCPSQLVEKTQSMPQDDMDFPEVDLSAYA